MYIRYARTTKRFSQVKQIVLKMIIFDSKAIF